MSSELKSEPVDEKDWDTLSTPPTKEEKKGHIPNCSRCAAGGRKKEAIWKWNGKVKAKVVIIEYSCDECRRYFQANNLKKNESEQLLMHFMADILSQQRKERRMKRLEAELA